MKKVLLCFLLGAFILGCNQNPKDSDTQRKQAKKEQVKKRAQNAQKNKKSSNTNPQKNKKPSKTNAQKNKKPSKTNAQKNNKEELIKLNKKWEDDGLPKKERAQKVYAFIIKDKKEAISFEEQLGKIMKGDKSEDEALDFLLKKCLSTGKKNKK